MGGLLHTLWFVFLALSMFPRCSYRKDSSRAGTELLEHPLLGSRHLPRPGIDRFVEQLDGVLHPIAPKKENGSGLEHPKPLFLN
jgi:hypothetical protein